MTAACSAGSVRHSLDALAGAFAHTPVRLAHPTPVAAAPHAPASRPSAAARAQLMGGPRPPVVHSQSDNVSTGRSMLHSNSCQAHRSGACHRASRPSHYRPGGHTKSRGSERRRNNRRDASPAGSRAARVHGAARSSSAPCQCPVTRSAAAAGPDGHPAHPAAQ